MTSANKSELYPVTIKIIPNTDLKSSDFKIVVDPNASQAELNNVSTVEIYNTRGGRLMNQSPNCFVDNDNLILGFLWDTTQDVYSVQEYYLFMFNAVIEYQGTLFRVHKTVTIFLKPNDVLIM